MLTMPSAAPAHGPALRMLAAKLRASPRGDILEAAKLRFINLPEVRERAGPRWPHLRARLCDGSLAALKPLLGVDDAVVQSADGFLVIFAEGDDVALARRAARIEETLTAWYAGEEGLQLLQARVKRCVVDARKLADLESVRHDLEPDPPAAPHIAAFPVWSLAAQTVACYLIVPTFCTDGAVRIGYDRRFQDFGIDSGADHVALDLRLLDVALHQAAALREIRAGSVVGVSVHASTLRDPERRRTYLRALAQAEPDLQRRFVVKIAEIENGARVLELAEWTALLRRSVRQVALEFHAHHRAPAGLGATKAWAAGFQLHPHTDHHAAAHEAPLRHWRSALAEAGIRFYVDNVCARSDLAAALEHGVDFVTSRRYWPPLHDIDALAPPRTQPVETPPGR